MSRADNFATFMSRLSRNMGVSTSWNPQGLYSVWCAFYSVKNEKNELKNNFEMDVKKTTFKNRN